MNRDDIITIVMFRKDKNTLEEAKKQMTLSYVKFIETANDYVFARELPLDTSKYYYVLKEYDKVKIGMLKPVPDEWYLTD